jgi:ABC-type multidrug transport system ATPase subunit
LQFRVQEITRPDLFVFNLFHSAIPFYNGLNILISKSSGETSTGMTWDERGDNSLPESTEYDSFWSFERSLLYLIGMFAAFSVLAWYVSNVMPNEHGKRQKPWFLFDPRYWGLVKAKVSTNSKAFAIDDTLEDAVKAEATIVKESDYGDRKVAVELNGLRKTFLYSKGCCEGSRLFTAVDGISYAIDENQCFCLLGHNGAGKTTTINMLTGNMDVSGGDATVFGMSIRHNMPSINRIMGVCPQHDILWEQLTGREHLELFAQLKGVPQDRLENEVNARLKDVLLMDAADVWAGSYSGGMRRRLSIAIALLGNPKIIYLDEPTTGMDPVTRREVWDMIVRAKKGRVILLTTHSMEEADVLGDRIGVMSHGQMQALGTSLELKRKFGAGFRLTMTLKEYNEDNLRKIVDFMKSEVEDAQLVSDVEGALLYQIPSKMETDLLIEFFRHLEEQAESLLISDVSLGLSTLEEVFLELSKMDHGYAPEEGITVEEEDGEKRGAAVKEIGLKPQIRAMLAKSATYQSRQVAQCCCVVLFPVVIMLLLLMLDSLLFQPLRQRAVCGRDVELKDCKAKGPNLDCVANQYSRTTTSIPDISVGVISNQFRGNTGINPNCGTTAANPEKTVCFSDLEQPDFNMITAASASTSSNVGGTSITATAEELAKMREWHLNLLFKSSNSSCEETYNDAFDASACSLKPFSEQSSCRNDVSKLIQAQLYELSQRGYAVGAAACYGTVDESASAEPRKPEQKYLDRLVDLNAARTTCRTSVYETIFAQFDGTALSSSLNVLKTKTTSSGVMGNFTTSLMSDPLFRNIENQLLAVLVSNAAARAIAMAYGINPFATSMAELCTAGCTYNATSQQDDCPLKPLLAPSVGGIARINGICEYLSNLDLVRLYTTTKYNTNAALDQALFDDWGGKEVSTPYMTSIPKSKVGYKFHFYLSKFGAFDFKSADNSKAQYDITAFYNNTGTGNGGQRTPKGNWKSLTWLIDNAVVKRFTSRQVSVKFKTMPRSFSCNRDEWIDSELSGAKNVDLKCDLLAGFLSFSILDFILIRMLPYILMLYMFVILSLVVYEKQAKLRMIMKMMGLKMSVYWAITYLFYLCQYGLMIVLMWVLGNMANVRSFTIHDPVLLGLFFFLWGNLLIAFSFVMSVFFNSTRTSTAVSFLLMLIFVEVGTNTYFVFIQSAYQTESQYTPLMFLPPMVMIRGVLWICLTGGVNEALTFDNWGSVGDGSMQTVFNWMFAEWIICLILLWYLENVVPVGYGTKRHPLFFLDGNYWRGMFSVSGTGAKTSSEAMQLSAASAIPDIVKQAGFTRPHDVETEHQRVISDEVEDSRRNMVKVAGLHKVFESRGGNPPKLAVKSVSLGVYQNECFGLLGHNGAGKTTLINMLTGLFAPSAGDAILDNHSILRDIAKIHAVMGVCPQHDILWNDLTAKEHLLFYGRLKGYSGSSLKNLIRSILSSVNLTNFANVKAGKFSGGMKRRLSVACSLVGSPSIVFMDEPSTGLDPASRRQLWDVISAAKGNKSIILTTHSMEEADVLCDRIAIMASGEMQCIGISPALKRRFGKGYTCQITTADKSADKYQEIDDFIHELFPTAKLLEEPIMGVSKYEVAREEVQLSTVFEKLEERKEEIGITDYGFTETTLEEVFLKLAQLSHMENRPLKRTLSDLARNGE